MFSVRNIFRGVPLLMLFGLTAAAGLSNHGALTGSYQVYPELTVQIAEKDGGLFFQLPHQPLLALKAGKDGVYEVETLRAKVSFKKGADGKVSGLVLNREGSRQRAKKVADEPDLSTVENQKPVKIDVRLYDAYVGNYEPGRDRRIVISREGDRLFGTVDDGQKLELLPLGVDEFYIKGMPGAVKFGRKNERVDYIEFEVGEKHQLARRMAPIKTPETQSRKKANAKLVGDWVGNLEVPGGSLQLIIRFATSADGYLVGSMDSPDQGAANIPVFKPAVAENRVGFGVPLVHGGFQGFLADDGKSINGKWFQEEMGIPLRWEKATDAPSMKRTQEPSAPFPYEEEFVRIENETDRVVLAGTLTHPDGVVKPPVVLLVTGSGPQNRDAAILGHKPFLVLADHLTRAGIAVLRMDDRGVGQSQGDVAQTGIGHVFSDAMSCVKYLKARKDLGKVGVIGHSEGGVVAAMTAAKTADVDFIVSLAAPGLSGREIVQRQVAASLRARNVGDDMVAANKKLFEQLLDTLRDNTDNPVAKTKLRKAISDFTKTHGEDVAEKLGFRMNVDRVLSNMVNPWYRSFAQLKPANHFGKLKQPTLVLIGELDSQTEVKDNTAAIESALKGSGHKKFEVVKMAGLNHLFQKAETGAFGEYVFIEETFNPKALAKITSWVKGLK